LSSRAEKVSGLSSKVQNILNVLKISTYPNWFEQNITWVKDGQISQDEFISAFDYGVSNGFITTTIPTRPEPEPSKRPTSIFREPTIPEPVVTTQQQVQKPIITSQQVQEQRQEEIIPIEQPLSKNWHSGSSVFVTSYEGARDLENASNGNFNDYATFDIDKTKYPNIGKMNEQYLTVMFDKTYIATEFKYKISGQKHHKQNNIFPVTVKLQHFDASLENWITDKEVTLTSSRSPQTFIIPTAPVNSNSMRVGFVASHHEEGDHVIRVYELQMYASEIAQVQEPEPIIEEVIEEPIIEADILDIIPQAEAKQITLSSESLTIIEGIENETYKVPQWFKQNIEWVQSGAITEQEFQNAFNFLIEQGAGIDTSIPEENTTINFPMVKQLGVSWRIEEGRVKGRVVLDKISANWNPYYDDRNLISIVQFKDSVNKLPLMPIKQNIVKFRPSVEPLLPTEEITIDEGIGSYQNALIEVFLWTENNEPVAEPLRFNINGSPIDVIAKPSQDNFLTKAVGLFAGLTGISLLLTGAKKLS